MARKKIKKYPFGGFPDLSGFQNLLKGFQGSDPSTWQDQVNQLPPQQRALMVDGATSDKIFKNVDQMGSLMDMMDLFKQKPQTNMNMDMFTVNPSRGYQFGGDIPEQEQPVPIQAEKGEKAVLPDGRITDVKATKKHKRMKDEEVTDILPPGSFIGSADKKMRFTKEEMEKMEFGYSPLKYAEHGGTPAPKVHTAAEIMNKKLMTPAQYLERVRALYPETKRENDAFAELAVEENLSSRQPFIMASQAITEMKSPEKNPKQARYGYYIPHTTMENQYANKLGLKDMDFKYGGDVPKYFLGGFARMIGSGLSAKREKKSLDTQYGYAKDANDLLRGLNLENLNQSQQMLGLSSLAGAMGVLGQDPTVKAPQLSTRFLDQMSQELPRYTRDYAAAQMQQSNRPMVNYAMQNAGNFQRGMNSLMPMQANATNALSNLSMQTSLQNQQLRDRYLQARQGLANQQESINADAENKTRAGRNTQIDNLFGRVGANYFQGTGNLQSAYLGNQASLEQQLAGAKIGRERGRSNADQAAINSAAGEIGGMMDAGTNIGLSLLGMPSLGGTAQQPQNPQTNYNPNYKFGDQMFQQPQGQLPYFSNLPTFNSPTSINTSTNFAQGAGINSFNITPQWGQGKRWDMFQGWVPR